jgi:hypothetical protein
MILEGGGTIAFPRFGVLSLQSCASFPHLGDKNWMLLSTFGICSKCNEEFTATTEQQNDVPCASNPCPIGA